MRRPRPEQLARRSVPPSAMSLLGLVRHTAEVERRWFRVRMAGLPDVPYYISPDEPDTDWDGAAPDQALVDLERLAVTAWSARDRTASRRSRTVIRRPAVARVVERGSRIITAACAAVLVVTLVSAPMVLRTTRLALDEIGGRIWELADGTRTITEIASDLVREYDAPLETIEADARRIVAELAGEQLIDDAPAA